MKKVGKILPWVLLLVVCVVFGFVWQSMNMQLNQNLNELTSLREQQKKITEEAQATIKKIEQEKTHVLSLVNQEKQKLLSEMDLEKAKLQAEAQQALQLANLPEAQLRVSFRKALTGGGNVAVFKSAAGTPIAINVEVKRPETNSSKQFDLTIDPNRVQEIGHREGWAFVSGDLILVNQPGHKSLKVSAP